jgi:EmrB/QacA subfamily drug resistance transporter
MGKIGQRLLVVKQVPRLTLNPKLVVSVVFVTAMFMNVMDITIVNVALPTIGHDLGVPAASLDAVAVGYLVSLAIVIPASGWLGDRFGSRRIMLLAIAIFTLASALCGIADTYGQLVFFRVLQGIGGGMLTPTGTAMLMRTFPPAERVKAASLLTVPVAFAPAIGPVLGGVLVTHLSWQWVFWVNIPIGIFALGFGLLFLRDVPQEHPGRFDLTGFLLSGLGFAALMYGISEGPSRGWGDPAIRASLVVGAVLLVAMVHQQLRTREPLLDLRLFGDRLFRASNVVMGLSAAGFLGMLYAIALFYQEGLGLSALNSGLTTFPEALGVMAGAQVASRLLYPRFGPRRLMVVGLIATAGAMATMTLVGADTNLWLVRLVMFWMGCAMAHVFVPTQAAAFTTISGPKTGRASTLFNAQRQLGSAVGVAVLSSVIAAVGVTTGAGSSLAPNLGAYHAAFLAAAGIMLLAAVSAAMVHDSDASATFPGRAKLAAERLAARGQPTGKDSLDEAPVPVSI